MGRTYRRGGNYNHNSYGKSLREKRQRSGNTRKSSEYFDNYDAYDAKTKNKNKEFTSIEDDNDYSF